MVMEWPIEPSDGLGPLLRGICTHWRATSTKESVARQLHVWFQIGDRFRYSRSGKERAGLVVLVFRQMAHESNPLEQKRLFETAEIAWSLRKSLSRHYGTKKLKEVSR